MSEKARFSFQFSFHRRMHLSYILLAVLALTALISSIAVKVIVERRERLLTEQITPKLNTERWHKDLLLYHDKTGKFPSNFRELEILIWNNGDAKKESLLTNGENLYVFDNYMYLYYADGANGQICSLWAVPIGEKKSEANTFLVLLTPKSYQTWKGLPLSDNDLDRIPKKAIPLDTELARLGMSKQIADNPTNSQPAKNILKQFGSGNK